MFENRLQNFIKLNELAENIHANGRRVAVVLEGRDGAGKSGTVKEITRYMPPYAYRVQPSFMPSKRMMKCWLPEWKKLLPKKGQMVIYDRSWYSRALLQPVMGWCCDRQYKNFMREKLGFSEFIWQKVIVLPSHPGLKNSCKACFEHQAC